MFVATRWKLAWVIKKIITVFLYVIFFPIFLFLWFLEGLAESLLWLTEKISWMLAYPADFLESVCENSYAFMGFKKYKFILQDASRYNRFKIIDSLRIHAKQNRIRCIIFENLNHDGTDYYVSILASQDQDINLLKLLCTDLKQEPNIF